jgi:acyl-CoA synthetase (NDP forming)
MAEEFRTRFEKHGIPAYETPERAARAMYALAKYGYYLCTHYPSGKGWNEREARGNSR